jgi:hypothetical protein
LDWGTICQTGELRHIDYELLFTFPQLMDKIIPAFEKAHGPGFQALIIVDNLQSHSAYAENALLVSQMNVRSGGKQACIRNRWFLRDGQKISQPMVFLCNHPDFPNEPKGIKTVLTDHGPFQSGLHGKCSVVGKSLPTCQ